MPGPVLSAQEQRAYRAIVRYADLFELPLTHSQCQALARTSTEAVLRGRPVDVLPAGRPRVPVDGPLGLRPDDLAVLRLLSEGLKSRAVADRLDMTTGAVDHRVKRLYAALGVETRAGLVEAGRRAGLAPEKTAASA